MLPLNLFCLLNFGMILQRPYIVCKFREIFGLGNSILFFILSIQCLCLQERVLKLLKALHPSYFVATPLYIALYPFGRSLQMENTKIWCSCATSLLLFPALSHTLSSLILAMSTWILPLTSFLITLPLNPHSLLQSKREPTTWPAQQL